MLKQLQGASLVKVGRRRLELLICSKALKMSAVIKKQPRAHAAPNVPLDPMILLVLNEDTPFTG